MQHYEKPHNILCVRLDNMGDVILTSPAFRALKESFPQSRLTLLTSSSGASIASFIPYLDKAIIFDAPWVKKTGSSGKVNKIIKKLRVQNFDTAVIFTNFSQNPLPSALLCYEAGILKRVAYCRENPYGLLTNWIPDVEPFQTISHGVKRQLHLVSSIGAKTNDDKLYLIEDKTSKNRIKNLLIKMHINVTLPLVIIHPGASEEKRQYPLQSFAQIAKKLLSDGYQVIITGTKSETRLVEYIDNFCEGKAITMLNLSLGELISLIKISDVLISNNTGPVHIAAAMQTPVVVLYAQTNPEHTPWKVTHKVFYFPVDKTLQTKNQILNFITYQIPSRFRVENVVTAAYRVSKKNLANRGISQDKILSL